MRIIKATNINHALYLGMQMIWDEGVVRDSRNGSTLDCGLVATEYAEPRQNIISLASRKANHMFHFADAMALIAGRNDVACLYEFNKQIAAYSDDGVTFNGSYGHRLRTQFSPMLNLLEKDPDTRRAYMTIADPTDLELSSATKDQPCNVGVMFRVNNNVLDMTVTNRSNDVIWGLFGANHVQFSMLHILVTECLGWQIGKYTHVSNSFHAYTTGSVVDTIEAIQNQYSDQAWMPELWDNYHYADVRMQSLRRLFSTVGNNASERWRTTRNDLRLAFSVQATEQITKPVCRAAMLLKLAREAYSYIRAKDPSKAIHAVFVFEDANSKCTWTEAFKTQIRTHFKQDY